MNTIRRRELLGPKCCRETYKIRLSPAKLFQTIHEESWKTRRSPSAVCRVAVSDNLAAQSRRIPANDLGHPRNRIATSYIQTTGARPCQGQPSRRDHISAYRWAEPAPAAAASRRIGCRTRISRPYRPISRGAGSSRLRRYRRSVAGRGQAGRTARSPGAPGQGAGSSPRGCRRDLNVTYQAHVG